MPVSSPSGPLIAKIAFRGQRIFFYTLTGVSWYLFRHIVILLSGVLLCQAYCINWWRNFHGWSVSSFLHGFSSVKSHICWGGMRCDLLTWSCAIIRARFWGVKLGSKAISSQGIRIRFIGHCCCVAQCLALVIHAPVVQYWACEGVSSPRLVDGGMDCRLLIRSQEILLSGASLWGWRCLSSTSRESSIT